MRKDKNAYSKYDSASDEEFKRLRIQANTVKPFDTNNIKKCIDALVAAGKKKGSTLYVVELGGASMVGSMTSRYNEEVLKYIDDAGFKLQIINVEYNEEAIKQAERYFGDFELNGKPLIYNHQIDLNDNPEQALKELNEKYTKGKGFDLIFSNYVLQHLQFPIRVLKACNENISKIGLTSHVVPDDSFKFLGFSNNGVLNERANFAGGKMVKLFLDTLHPTVDRFAGGNLYEQCPKIFAHDYTQIAIDSPQTAEETQKYLKRDFWYGLELLDAGESGLKGAIEAGKKAQEQLEIIKKEIANGATYALGEYRITAGNNEHFKTFEEEHIEEGKTLKNIERVKDDLMRIRKQLESSSLEN